MMAQIKANLVAHFMTRQEKLIKNLDSSTFKAWHVMIVDNSKRKWKILVDV